MENILIQDNTLRPTWRVYIGLMVAVIILLLMMSTSCSKSENKKNVISNITVEKLFELSQADSSLFLLDVRTPEEFTEKHLTFASALIPYDQLKENSALLPTDKTTPIYSFCRSGNRSGKAAKTLASMGYQTIYNVEGGIMRWEEVGYPITSGEFKR